MSNPFGKNAPWIRDQGSTRNPMPFIMQPQYPQQIMQPFQHNPNMMNQSMSSNMNSGMMSSAYNQRNNYSTYGDNSSGRFERRDNYDRSSRQSPGPRGRTKRSPPPSNDYEAKRRRRTPPVPLPPSISKRNKVGMQQDWNSDLVPNYKLSITELDVFDVSKRYESLYIPSDFFHGQVNVHDSFPIHKQFCKEIKPTQFHLLRKVVKPMHAVERDAPADVDYTYSAKVMLLSTQSLMDLFEKSIPDSVGKIGIHLGRILSFLVGTRGLNEPMALGGPWSPSLDGLNPATDPTVLIKTAVRNCKRLTGIDLSACTKWYRFLTLEYHRAEKEHNGVQIPARVETVVIYLPNAWTLMPSQVEWEKIQALYKQQLQERINELESGVEKKEEAGETKSIDYSGLEVEELKNQLAAQSLDITGSKSELIARLKEAKKKELDKAEKRDKDKKGKEKPKLDKAEEKRQLERRFKLPDEPHILVHPNYSAKNGQFNCSVVPLSVLLKYDVTDLKEYMFEVSLFCEMFHELLQRGFGFYILKSMFAQAERIKARKTETTENIPKDEHADDEDFPDGDEIVLDEITMTDDEGDDKPDGKEKEQEKNGEKNDKGHKSSEKSDRDKHSTKNSSSSRDKERSRSRRRDDKPSKITRNEVEDSYLRFCFSYFGASMNIAKVEKLINCLDLKFSRSQIKSLLRDVNCKKDLTYHRLYARKEDPEIDEQKLIDLCLQNVHKHEQDNLGSIKQENSKEVNDYVTYQGVVVSLSQIMEQLKEKETESQEREERYASLKDENKKLLEKYQVTKTDVKDVSKDLKIVKDKLAQVNKLLTKNTINMNRYYTAIERISTIVEPFKEVSHVEKKERSAKDKKEKNDKNDKTGSDRKTNDKNEIATETRNEPQSSNTTEKVEETSVNDVEGNVDEEIDGNNDCTSAVGNHENTDVKGEIDDNLENHDDFKMEDDVNTQMDEKMQENVAEENANNDETKEVTPIKRATRRSTAAAKTPAKEVASPSKGVQTRKRG